MNTGKKEGTPWLWGVGVLGGGGGFLGFGGWGVLVGFVFIVGFLLFFFGTRVPEGGTISSAGWLCIEAPGGRGHSRPKGSTRHRRGKTDLERGKQRGDLL